VKDLAGHAEVDTDHASRITLDGHLLPVPMQGDDRLAGKKVRFPRARPPRRSREVPAAQLNVRHLHTEKVRFERPLQMFNLREFRH